MKQYLAPGLPNTGVGSDVAFSRSEFWGNRGSAVCLSDDVSTCRTVHSTCLQGPSLSHSPHHTPRICGPCWPPAQTCMALHSSANSSSLCKNKSLTSTSPSASFSLGPSDFAGTPPTHSPLGPGEEGCIWGWFPCWTKNVTLSEEITGLQQRLCFNASSLVHSWLTQKYECVQNVFVSVKVKVGVSTHCVYVYVKFCAYVFVLASGVERSSFFFRNQEKSGSFLS